MTDYQGERSIQLNPFVREVFDGYTAIMDEIYDANAQVVPTISNARLRRGAELADTSAHQRDISAQFIRTLLRTVVETPANGVDTPAEINELATLLGTLRRNAETIQTKAEGPYEKMADELFAKEHIRKYPEVIQNVLDTGDVDINLVLETSTGDEAGGFGYTVFSKQVNDQLRADADDVRADADRRLRTYGILAALAIALALVTTWLVSKSLTRPLRALTRQATEMASTRLPNAVRSILNTPLGEDVEIPQVEPITVKTRDEVGDVAEALNTVQETALELAVEQAVLRRNIADSFVNLGRRNQNLLGRQLDFITELESNETDPDTLASLFRLDHLATRMRRNAESLLVLAGIDPPRRWSAPVRLNDVIRAALGEVEDYQRVSVAGVEPATVVGSAAADLAHLIAEFVENALTFSPPDQNVEVRGRHIDAGYTLAIIDNGFGMAPDDIERANRRLAGSESFTVAPSKYLGHYVAGNLAARHEVTLRLEQSPGSGVTALIHLAPELVAGSDVDGTALGQPVAAVPLPAEVRNRKALAAIGANGNGANGGNGTRRQRARPGRRRPGRAARGRRRGGRGPARRRPSADADAQHRPRAARPRAAAGPARPAGRRGSRAAGRAHGQRAHQAGTAEPGGDRRHAPGRAARRAQPPHGQPAGADGPLPRRAAAAAPAQPHPGFHRPRPAAQPPRPGRRRPHAARVAGPGRRRRRPGPAPRCPPPGRAARSHPAAARSGRPPAPPTPAARSHPARAPPPTPGAPRSRPARAGHPPPAAAASRPRRATPAWAAASRRRRRRLRPPSRPLRPAAPATAPAAPPTRRGRPSAGSPAPTGAHDARRARGPLPARAPAPGPVA